MKTYGRTFRTNILKEKSSEFLNKFIQSNFVTFNMVNQGSIVCSLETKIMNTLLVCTYYGEYNGS